jgi:hypothetical protein
LHALADPDFFLRQEFIELGVLYLFDFQLLGLAYLVGREIAWEGQDAAAVQFNDAGSDVIQ